MLKEQFSIVGSMFIHFFTERKTDGTVMSVS